MTTIAPELARADRARPRLTRFFPPAAGLGLVGGLIAMMASPMGDDAGQTAPEVVAFATTHEAWIVAMLLFGVASVALGGGFVAGLHARLRGSATSAEAALVLIGGTAFTVCFVLSTTFWTAPLTDVPSDRARALAQAEAYLAVDDVGWFMLGAAGVGAAVMAVAACLAALREGLPAWLGWFGVALGVASLATVAFVGMLAWMAWIALAAIVLAVAPAGDR